MTKKINNRPPRPRLREKPQVRIQFGSTFPLGPGKVKLIEAIQSTGSISAAARHARMSYRRAWMLIDEVNRSFKDPLILTSTGGKGGGGAKVTSLGQIVVDRYRDLENKVNKSIEKEVLEFGQLLDTDTQEKNIN